MQLLVVRVRRKRVTAEPRKLIRTSPRATWFQHACVCLVVPLKTEMAPGLEVLLMQGERNSQWATVTWRLARIPLEWLIRSEACWYETANWSPKGAIREVGCEREEGVKFLVGTNSQPLGSRSRFAARITITKVPCSKRRDARDLYRGCFGYCKPHSAFLYHFRAMSRVRYGRNNGPACFKIDRKPYSP